MKLLTKSRFKKLFTVLIVSLVGLMISLGISVAWINFLFNPPAKSEKGQAVIDIPVNANADIIANILYQEGLIKSCRAFSLYVRYTGADSKLKAGEYTLDTGQTVPQIVQKIIKGSTNGYSVTVPEGYNIRQIVNLLVAKGLTDKKNFYETAGKSDFTYTFLKDINAGDNRLEGYLFPDTYSFDKDGNSKEIIDMMLSRFNFVITELNYEQKVNKMGLTLNQAVTIASMIEREAKYDNERPVIAGVIFNRLRLGMPLQIDATVQYALGTNRTKLYNKDLEINSPYNTYRINGLPPGPIASPGKPSLLAVVSPEKSGYLYYLAKPDGTHVFAKSLAEHNKNKALYIK